MKITEASGKPTKLLINRLSVRAAELRLIYETLASSPSPETPSSENKLINRFSSGVVKGIDTDHRSPDIDDEHLQECLDFLHTVDMIERPEARAVKLVNRDAFDGSFEARLLAHVQAQSGKQAHLGDIHRIALSENGQTVTFDRLVADLNRELNYETTWNATKMRMWTSLHTQLGVVTRTSSEGVILSPCRALLHELLTIHDREHETKDLADALRWIETHFIRVFDSQAGVPEVHPAISEVIRNMADDGAVDIRGIADAENEVRLPAAGQYAEPRTVKEVIVKQPPERPAAYRYPLDQQTQEITA